MLNEIVKVTIRGRENGETDNITLYNKWASTSSYKVDDLNLVVWLLDFIKDLFAVNTEMLKQSVVLDK